MSRSRITRLLYCFSLIASLPLGCQSLSTCKTQSPHSTNSGQKSSHGPDPVVTAAHHQTESPEPLKPGEDALSALSELSADMLIQQVLARNPSLAQMGAAWQAASARYPQVRALDDPMFGATIGPASFGSKEVDDAYKLDVAQKLPFPGKLRLRGETSLAEAAAAGNEVEVMRLQLVESAFHAFYDYYLVYRAIEVNEESLRLLKEFKQNAESRYKTGLVPQQDILQADVEIGRAQERGLLLERMLHVAIARLNTLMHLAPDCPLPPPPKKLELREAVVDACRLRSVALARRPDLQALANRIAAEEATLGLAYKEYYPDFEVMAAYDKFWQEKDLRPMVGVRLNLPVQIGRRRGMVAEAQAKIAQRRAELEKQTDQINFEVQQAYEQVIESERVVRLYEKTILPAASENVKAAQSAYVTGKVPFLSLIEAQRNLIGLRDRYYEALADYFRRRATLERVTGGPLSPAPNLIARLDSR